MSLTFDQLMTIMDFVTEELGFNTEIRGSICCSSCAVCELDDTMDPDSKMAIYFHEQDGESIASGDSWLHLRHMPSDGHEPEYRDNLNKLIALFSKNGVDCMWDLITSHTIQIRVDNEDPEWEERFKHDD